MSVMDISKDGEQIKKLKEKLKQIKIEQLKQKEKQRLSKIRTQVKKQEKQWNTSRKLYR